VTSNVTSGNGTEAVYSEWSLYGYCSVKCGGGVRIRTRHCVQGNCDPEKFMEQQSCGTLPCVAGK